MSDEQRARALLKEIGCGFWDVEHKERSVKAATTALQAARREGRDELEQSLWAIIDRDGLGNVPSDIHGAVARLVQMAAKADAARREGMEAAALAETKDHYERRFSEECDRVGAADIHAIRWSERLMALKDIEDALVRRSALSAKSGKAEPQEPHHG